MAGAFKIMPTPCGTGYAYITEAEASVRPAPPSSSRPAPPLPPPLAPPRARLAVPTGRPAGSLWCCPPDVRQSSCLSSASLATRRPDPT